jgi:hypothetical protein
MEQDSTENSSISPAQLSCHAAVTSAVASSAGGGGVEPGAACGALSSLSQPTPMSVPQIQMEPIESKEQLLVSRLRSELSLLVNKVHKTDQLIKRFHQVNEERNDWRRRCLEAESDAKQQKSVSEQRWQEMSRYMMYQQENEELKVQLDELRLREWNLDRLRKSLQDDLAARPSQEKFDALQRKYDAALADIDAKQAQIKSLKSSSRTSRRSSRALVIRRTSSTESGSTNASVKSAGIIDDLERQLDDISDQNQRLNRIVIELRKKLAKLERDKAQADDHCSAALVRSDKLQQRVTHVETLLRHAEEEVRLLKQHREPEHVSSQVDNAVNNFINSLQQTPAHVATDYDCDVPDNTQLELEHEFDRQMQSSTQNEARAVPDQLQGHKEGNQSRVVHNTERAKTNIINKRQYRRTCATQVVDNRAKSPVVTPASSAATSIAISEPVTADIVRDAVVVPAVSLNRQQLSVPSESHGHTRTSIAIHAMVSPRSMHDCKASRTSPAAAASARARAEQFLRSMNSAPKESSTPKDKHANHRTSTALTAKGPVIPKRPSRKRRTLARQPSAQEANSSLLPPATNDASTSQKRRCLVQGDSVEPVANTTLDSESTVTTTPILSQPVSRCDYSAPSTTMCHVEQKKPQVQVLQQLQQLQPQPQRPSQSLPLQQPLLQSRSEPLSLPPVSRTPPLSPLSQAPAQPSPPAKSGPVIATQSDKMRLRALTGRVSMFVESHIFHHTEAVSSTSNTVGISTAMRPMLTVLLTEARSCIKSANASSVPKILSEWTKPLCKLLADKFATLDGGNHRKLSSTFAEFQPVSVELVRTSHCIVALCSSIMQWRSCQNIHLRKFIVDLSRGLLEPSISIDECMLRWSVILLWCRKYPQLVSLLTTVLTATVMQRIGLSLVVRLVSAAAQLFPAALSIDSQSDLDHAVSRVPLRSWRCWITSFVLTNFYHTPFWDIVSSSVTAGAVLNSASKIVCHLAFSDPFIRVPVAYAARALNWPMLISSYMTAVNQGPTSTHVDRLFDHMVRESLSVFCQASNNSDSVAAFSASIELKQTRPLVWNGAQHLTADALVFIAAWHGWEWTYSILVREILWPEFASHQWSSAQRSHMLLLIALVCGRIGIVSDTEHVGAALSELRRSIMAGLTPTLVPFLAKDATIPTWSTVETPELQPVMQALCQLGSAKLLPLELSVAALNSIQ